MSMSRAGDGPSAGDAANTAVNAANAATDTAPGGSAATARSLRGRDGR